MNTTHNTPSAPAAVNNSTLDTRHSPLPASVARFRDLPDADQTFVCQLCDEHTYRAALKLLAQPRPVGLGIQSNYSSLRRFHIARLHDPLAPAFQTAHSHRIARERIGPDFYTGIVTLVEHQVYDQLRRGRPVKDLDKELSLLTRVQRSYLALEERRFRLPSSATAASDRYDEEFREAGNTPDFNPVTLPAPVAVPAPSHEPPSDCRSSAACPSVASQPTSDPALIRLIHEKTPAIPQIPKKNSPADSPESPAAAAETSETSQLALGSSQVKSCRKFVTSTEGFM